MSKLEDRGRNQCSRWLLLQEIGAGRRGRALLYTYCEVRPKLSNDQNRPRATAVCMQDSLIVNEEGASHANIHAGLVYTKVRCSSWYLIS